MEVAIVSDTHVPDREESIPDPHRRRIREADHAIHAGDFTSRATYDEVVELADEDSLTAVRGNMDPPGDIDPDAVGLAEVAAVDLGGVTFVVTHGTVRSPDDWYDAVADAARGHGEDPVVGVGGHTHRVEDEVHEGVRVLNPGSVTGAAPAERATMLTATVADGAVEVTVHEA
ncbi:YfcE family phosphodiesterase [Halobacteriales archaeon QS_8_69_26]|nr:MAG: YfcE family phosphodiesterase [Halobacteriales archaeon QS_8_69_26]